MVTRVDQQLRVTRLMIDGPRSEEDTVYPAQAGPVYVQLPGHDDDHRPAFYPHAAGGNRPHYDGAESTGRKLQRGVDVTACQGTGADFVPLFVSSFRRAEELATAMECRCYRGDEGRTKMRQLHAAGRDYAAMTVTLVFLAAAVATKIIW